LGALQSDKNSEYTRDAQKHKEGGVYSENFEVLYQKGFQKYHQGFCAAHIHASSIAIGA